MATIWVNDIRKNNKNTQNYVQPVRPTTTAPQTASQYPTQGYTGLAGVSQNTAKQAGQAQQKYQPGQAVTQAQQQLNQIQAQKPQGYNSKYGAQLDNILQQIQNPEQFKYEFNGDNLFKAYADLYTQKGKQASLDAMGQAAGLTGGYGNSYGQMAGQQAYDQYLLSLYDKGMDLYDRARQAYNDRRNDLYNQYGTLQGADETEYGRYRDTVGDWKDDRAYYENRYEKEADRDYDRWAAERDYWTGLAQVENADYRTEQERQEAIRQYEQNFAEDVYRADQDEAYRRDTLGWQQDTDQRDYDRAVLESDRDYKEAVKRADEDEAYRQAMFDWQKETDTRDYDRSVLESDRDYEEAVKRADQDEAYRQAQLAESIRQFDLSLDWDKMSSDQKYAYQYVMGILENGQMPSDELLAAAGLSAEDAEKLKAIVEEAATGSPGTKKEEEEETQTPISPLQQLLGATNGTQNKVKELGQAQQVKKTAETAKSNVQKKATDIFNSVFKKK